jgi:hypothetical protein
MWRPRERAGDLACYYSTGVKSEEMAFNFFILATACSVFACSLYCAGLVTNVNLCPMI